MTPDQGPLVLTTREDLRELLSEELARHLAPVVAAVANHVPARTEPNGNEGMLTRVELAKLLNVNVRTVQRLSLLGQVPTPVKVGRSVRWPRPTIERWLQERR
jgi:predicted DNA-binding transcriptional regulator AlpA